MRTAPVRLGRGAWRRLTAVQRQSDSGLQPDNPENHETTDALNRIAQALGWVQDRIDAARTNFNDLNYDSPLTRTVSFAGGSDKTWLFIVTDVNDRFLADAPSFRRLDSIALRGPVVIVAERLPAEAPAGWAMLDLEARAA